MKKLLFLLAPIFFLSSCFEIIEEVDLKSDGSGSVSYTINLSQSKTKINSAKLLDSIDGFKIPDEQDIRNKVAEFEKLISEAEGISQVSSKQDYDNYIFTFKCNFTNPEALNKASELVKSTYNVRDPNNNTDDHFSYDSDSKTFTRKGDYKGKADMKKIEDEDLSMLNSAEFTSIYRFENEVVSVSNKDAKISPSKKAVMLKYKAMDVANGTKKIGNTITLK